MARRKAKAEDEVITETAEKAEEPVKKEPKSDDSEFRAEAEAYVLHYTRRAELNDTLQKAADDLAALAKERGEAKFTGAPREIYDILNTYRR